MWAPYFVISSHPKEPSGGHNHPRYYHVASFIVIAALLRYQQIKQIDQSRNWCSVALHLRSEYSTSRVILYSRSK